MDNRIIAASQSCSHDSYFILHWSIHILKQAWDQWTSGTKTRAFGPSSARVPGPPGWPQAGIKAKLTRRAPLKPTPYKTQFKIFRQWFARGSGGWREGEARASAHHFLINIESWRACQDWWGGEWWSGSRHRLAGSSIPRAAQKEWRLPLVTNSASSSRTLWLLDDSGCMEVPAASSIASYLSQPFSPTQDSSGCTADPVMSPLAHLPIRLSTPCGSSQSPIMRKWKAYNSRQAKTIHPLKKTKACRWGFFGAF